MIIDNYNDVDYDNIMEVVDCSQSVVNIMNKLFDEKKKNIEFSFVFCFRCVIGFFMVFENIVDFV